jgi:hypothetical protein
MSKHAQRITEVFEAGLRVNENGEVIGVSGRVRSIRIVVNSCGYRKAQVSVSLNGKSSRITVAKLAAYQWFGAQALAPNTHVRHLDGNSLNNAKANLAIGTASENSMDRPMANRVASAKFAATKIRRLSEEEVAAFRLDRAAGMSLNALSKKYKIAKSTASYIVNNKTYRVDGSQI